MYFMLVNVLVWLTLVTGIVRNSCTERGKFLSFRTGIPDGLVANAMSKTRVACF